jgi:hypothetical protein
MSETADWVPCLTGPLTDMKRMLEACKAEGISAALWAEESCEKSGGCGCGPKIHLIAPQEEIPKVAALMQHQWMQALHREGTLVERQAAPGEDPPCPACGSTQALAQGACPDCGLQLA